MSGDLTDSFISRSPREPILLYRGVARCPACGSKALNVSEYIYEVPYFGKVILSSGVCNACGFRYRDVRVAEATKPKKIVVNVFGESELRYFLVKSARAMVYIPEKGYEMVPGPASMGFISTVEGILHRFLEVLEVLCRDNLDSKACLENRKWLQSAIEGKEKFTLVICDYEGTSIVVGENVVYEDIDEFCLEKAEKVNN